MISIVVLFIAVLAGLALFLVAACEPCLFIADILAVVLLAVTAGKL